MIDTYPRSRGVIAAKYYLLRKKYRQQSMRALIAGVVSLMILICTFVVMVLCYFEE